jgi:tetratricopeptide (TPR) repeat protein
MEKVKELVAKAKESVKERQFDASEALFNKILELDPENFDVPQLRIELDAWKKEQDRIAMEKATAEADRKRKLDLFQPVKNIYLQRKWYLAISKLEDFLKIKDMDEDFIKEASNMLADSKEKLNEIESPLLGKARSLKEGQDLKGAYEQYGKVLSYNPTNTEALNEMTEIKDILHTRAKKLYREAIISESLSLFQDAKEKLQEVQQVSPIESEYYKKATDKLNDYLE